MKQYFIINLCFLVIWCTSCHNTAKYDNAVLFFFEDFKTTTRLNAATIEFDEPIMLPLFLVKSDSLLIVNNIKSNNMLYIYNVNSMKKVGEFISWGSGPNDLLRIKNMQLVDSDLYVTDNLKKVIYKYNVNDFHTLTDNIVPTQKVIIKNDLFLNLAYTDNGYVSTAMNPDNKRLVFYNSRGEQEFSAGEYPYFGEKLNSRAILDGFNSFIAVGHQCKRIYLFGMNTDLIEIYDFQGMLIKRIHGPEQLFPQVKEILSNDGRRISTSKSKCAFFCPIIVDNEIFVAYSGKPQEINNEVATIQHIFVFDMDCNPIRRYELSKPIVSFTVDTEMKNIYATSNIPEYHMVLFELCEAPN